MTKVVSLQLVVGQIPHLNEQKKPLLFAYQQHVTRIGNTPAIAPTIVIPLSDLGEEVWTGKNPGFIFENTPSKRMFTVNGRDTQTCTSFDISKCNT